MSTFLGKISSLLDKAVRGVKIGLNHLHGILTTAKSVAAIVLAGGTGLSAALGSPAWLVALLAFAAGLVAWEIPYDPFELKDYSG